MVIRTTIDNTKSNYQFLTLKYSKQAAKINDIKIRCYQPAHYDPGESRLRDFQQEAETLEDQHMHAKAPNSNISSPLHIFPTPAITCMT